MFVLYGLQKKTTDSFQKNRSQQKKKVSKGRKGKILSFRARLRLPGAVSLVFN